MNIHDLSKAMEDTDASESQSVRQWDSKKWEEFAQFLKARFNIELKHDELPQLKFSTPIEKGAYFSLEVNLDTTIKYGLKRITG
jgi:hypothetical protein